MIRLVGLVLPADPASRAAALSVYMNATLMVVGIAIGLISGSVAVLSDGIDNGQDTVAAAIALASVRVGARPADLGHPYGHGGAETLAATLRGVLIGGGGVFIIASAGQRLLDPRDAISVDLAIFAIVLAAAANLALVQYVTRVTKQTGSPAIAAEAKHVWTNVVQAGAVLLSLVIVAATGEVAFDSLIAMALGLFLIWTAATILRTAVEAVLDRSLAEEEMGLLEEAILESRDEIAGYHRLRTRRSGRGRYVELHLILAPELTVGAAHAITERVEAAIEARLPGAVLTIHVEPQDGRFLGPLDGGESRGREGEVPPGRPNS